MEIGIFEINYQTDGDLTLPVYSGSTLRGAFGNAFRKIVCPFKNKECRECLLLKKCVYTYVFETPVPEGSNIMRKYEYVPHPFIIEPPFDKEIKTRLSFNFLLIGRAIDYLPYFIYTFEEMGLRGLGKARSKLNLYSIVQKNKTIYDGRTKTLKDNVYKETISFIQPRRKIECIKLKFLTPTRIVYKGETLKNPEFEKIIPNLLRRIFLLSYFHCDKTLSIDFKGLLEKARSIKTNLEYFKFQRWDRYSSRQKKEIPMEGFIGEVIYEGNLTPFYPYLKAGEILHIGKGTAFGMGKYVIEKS
jgi:CRISPR-associated endoribonuclease Cas6